MPLPQPTLPGMQAVAPPPPQPQPGQPAPQQQQNVGQLFQPLTPQQQPNKPNLTVKRGAIVLFSYQNWLHDPSPMILVTDVQPGFRIRGVNLHYLTFPSIKNLLNQAKLLGGQVTYQMVLNILGEEYIPVRVRPRPQQQLQPQGPSKKVRSFRSYKWQSVRQLKVLDIDYVLTAIATIRSIDPAEIEKMRKVVQDQLRRQVNPKADAQEQEPSTLNTPETLTPGTTLVPTAPTAAPPVPTVPVVGQSPNIGGADQGIQ